MKDVQFVELLIERVIDEADAYCQTALDSENNATTPIWIEVIDMYRKFQPHEKAVFLKFLRLARVNATAQILAILDGVSHLGDEFIEFELRLPGSNRLNGELAEIFLEIEEERNNGLN